jgi:hypothetical protein
MAAPSPHHGEGRAESPRQCESPTEAITLQHRRRPPYRRRRKYLEILRYVDAELLTSAPRGATSDVITPQSQPPELMGTRIMLVEQPGGFALIVGQLLVEPAHVGDKVSAQLNS